MIAFLLSVVPLRTARATTSCYLQRLQIPKVNSSQYATSNRRNRQATLCVATPSKNAATPPSSSTLTEESRTVTNPTVQRYLSLGLSVVILKSGKSRLFRSHRPTTIYPVAIRATVMSPSISTSITSATSATIPAETEEIPMSAPVAVLDASFIPLAYGVYNPVSLFRVRILRLLTAQESEVHEIESWAPCDSVRSLLREAITVRKRIGLPNKGTDAYRIVNSDGDGLSGLFIDRFGCIAVVSSCAAWCEVFRDDIESAIHDELKNDGISEIVWRSHPDRLRQDGLEFEKSDDIEDKKEEGGIIEKKKNKHGDGHDVVVGKEDGVLFELPWFALQSGQKTGHFADQRDARAYLRQILSSSTTPTRVLDLFCYSGGFALNAAMSNPIIQVLGVDSSQVALNIAQRNAELNNLNDRVEFIRGDAAKFANDYAGELFDVVIVDPPKFAPNVKALPRALGKYKRVNETALKMFKSDGGTGILVSCSCSAAVAQKRQVLVDAVREGAAACGKEVRLLKTFGAGADHPIHTGMMETEYLTVCVFSVR